jgi:hypothetical protein
MSQNGKGSAPRVRTAAEQKKFEQEYERIFRKKAKGKKKAW